MRRVIVFLALVILFFAISIPAVCTQIENLPWGVERVRADQVWDTDMWPQDFIVDPDGNAGQGAGRADIDMDKIVWTRDHGTAVRHFGEMDP